MRSIIVMAMFVASLAGAAGGDYEEQRELRLGANGIEAVEIDAGAGSLKITGQPGLDEVQVSATIVVPVVPGRDDESARKAIESHLVLTIERRGNRAVVNARFDGNFRSFGDSPMVDLEVRMPEDLDLLVDDGSGSIELAGVRGNVELEDGSGSITIADAGGSVTIDDGSGSITATGIGGDFSIDDGSGSITVRGVAGSVIIDDGSGGIDVSDIDADLVIVDDGSGGLHYSDIRGRVETEG